MSTEIVTLPTTATKRPSLDDVRQRVRDMDPRLPEDSVEFDAAVLLHAATIVGSRNLAALSRFTENPYARVRMMGQRLRRNGIWTYSGQTVANWFEEYGEESFWADVNVALGLLQLTQRQVGAMSSTRSSFR